MNIRFYAFFILAFTLFLSPLSFASIKNVQTINNATLSGQAAYRFLKITDDQNTNTFYINAVLLNNNHYSAQIVDQEKEVSFFSINQIYKTTLENNAFLGINGGFFLPNKKPLGLLIIDGKQVSDYSHSHLLSGFVFIDKKGAVNITDRKEPYENMNNAIQTGPFLINLKGQIAVKPHPIKDRRTVLALTDNNDLLVLATNETTLFDLATLLHDHSDWLGVKKIRVAINLDGGTSTAMSLFLPSQQPLVIPEILPVRSGIIFKLK